MKNRALHDGEPLTRYILNVYNKEQQRIVPDQEEDSDSDDDDEAWQKMTKKKNAKE